MNIWIDGDGFPARQREIALQAAIRGHIAVTVVSDRLLRVPDSSLVRQIVVKQGDDSADDAIASSVSPGDLVITRDILLMERCIEMGARCIDHVGSVTTKENISERVSVRAAMVAYREYGGTVAPKRKDDQKQRQAFANTLVKELAGRM